jgi:hypothetical protein
VRARRLWQVAAGSSDMGVGTVGCREAASEAWGAEKALSYEEHRALGRSEPNEWTVVGWLVTDGLAYRDCLEEAHAGVRSGAPSEPAASAAQAGMVD